MPSRIELTSDNSIDSFNIAPPMEGLYRLVFTIKTIDYYKHLNDYMYVSVSNSKGTSPYTLMEILISSWSVTPVTLSIPYSYFKLAYSLADFFSLLLTGIHVKTHSSCVNIVDIQNEALYYLLETTSHLSFQYRSQLLYYNSFGDEIPLCFIHNLCSNDPAYLSVGFHRLLIMSLLP